MARSGLSRRELLRRAGLAGTAILALPGVGRLIGAGRGLAAQARSLTAGSLATLRAVCARLIPTDENGPGATEAHAAEYIERSLRGALAPSRADYVQGLAAIDRVAQQKFGGPFTKLSPEQQDAVLTDLQETPFFAIVRGHTLQGTFCDPVYGGNADFVGWDLLGYPGVRLTVAANEQNMSTPPTPKHTSAYDSAMFSRTGIDGD